LETASSSTVEGRATLREYIRNPLPRKEHLTGKAILELCDVVFRPTPALRDLVDVRRERVFHAAVPARDAIVWCRVEHGEILDLFRECRSHPGCRYVVIQSLLADDGTVDRAVLEAMPENVVRVYAKNVAVDSPRVASIPIGRDPRNREVDDAAPGPLPESRPRLLLSNFALSTNPGLRRRLYRRYRWRRWVTTVKVRHWGRYPLSPDQYLQLLRAHAFCLCPPGRGIDTFRTWDALYSGTIPVVSKGLHMSRFTGLPILPTDDFSDLTPRYLRAARDRILDTPWDFRLLGLSHWRARILGDAGRSAPAAREREA
jgi:hypothetical protein